MPVSGASAGGRRWHGRGRRWRRGDGGDRSGGDHSDRVGQKDEGIKARGRGERREAKEASGGQARTQRGGSEATVRRAHQVRIPATPMHTHTHAAISRSARSPAAHSAPAWRHAHGLTIAFSACSGGNNERFGENVQIETTGDSARTCRSCGRTDRVGARIGRTHVGWAHRSGAQVCVWMWVGMREENGSCAAGRSVPRTVGEQDDQCAGRSIMGVAPTLGMDSCCV